MRRPEQGGPQNHAPSQLPQPELQRECIKAQKTSARPGCGVSPSLRPPGGGAPIRLDQAASGTRNFTNRPCHRARSADTPAAARTRHATTRHRHAPAPPTRRNPKRTRPANGPNPKRHPALRSATPRAHPEPTGDRASKAPRGSLFMSSTSRDGVRRGIEEARCQVVGRLRPNWYSRSMRPSASRKAMTVPIHAGGPPAAGTISTVINTPA